MYFKFEYTNLNTYFLHMGFWGFGVFFIIFINNNDYFDLNLIKQTVLQN